MSPTLTQPHLPLIFPHSTPKPACLQTPPVTQPQLSVFTLCPLGCRGRRAKPLAWGSPPCEAGLGPGEWGLEPAGAGWSPASVLGWRRAGVPGKVGMLHCGGGPVPGFLACQVPADLPQHSVCAGGACPSRLTAGAEQEDCHQQEGAAPLHGGRQRFRGSSPGWLYVSGAAPGQGRVGVRAGRPAHEDLPGGGGMVGVCPHLALQGALHRHKLRCW